METITGCIAHSSQTSERMLSKYEETASNINTIEDVMENMMCDLGIGGFMGIEDIQPGMKIDLKVAGQGDTEYLGELIEQIPETKIRMMNGDYYLVKDSVESIKDQVPGLFQRCVSIKKEMQI